MSDYLSRLVAKNLNSAQLILPRLKLRFEPPSLSGEMVYGSDSLGGGIVSSSIKSDADAPIPRSPNSSLEISKETLLSVPMSELDMPHSRNDIERTELLTQIDPSQPVSRISDLQIQSSSDGMLAPSVPVRADISVKRTEHEVQIDPSHPVSLISDHQTQSIPDAMLASSVSSLADRRVKRTEQGIQIGLSHSISQISDRQIQSSPDAMPSSPLPGSADKVSKRAGLKTQNSQSRPIGRGSDRQIQSSPDAMTILPVPLISISPDERRIMGKRGNLEAADSAEHRSHKNSLRLSDEDDGLMQSLASAQKARLSISTQSPAKTIRSKDPDVTVETIIAPQKEIWFMDQSKDAFREKSPPRSNSSIKVNIGRIEVRAAAPAQAPPPPQKVVSTSKSGLSLDDYLKRRR